MTEYTPTTNEIRNIVMGVSARFACSPDEFDRWLAAHDADVRASVVAEEPEWEYGVGWNYPGASAPMGTRYPNRRSAEDIIRRYPLDQDFGTHYLVRREPQRAAGPWVPVE